ncbi:MAG: hypothetical protein IPK69_05940 [Phycisphaerales bacterium]|nr:MAG: hypothetical protein IPK69_05940 [Phycisphaerales bacterium]
MSNQVTKISVSPEQMNRAAAVGPKAALQSVHLVNVNAMLDTRDGVVAKHVRHTRSHSFERIGESAISVTIRFGVDIASSEEEKAEPPTSIECKYVLNYLIDDLQNFDDDHLLAFSQINGYFNAWPFWRELTTSMLARSKSGFFLLPTLRVDQSLTDK